jgi:hypothetical protein
MPGYRVRASTEATMTISSREETRWIRRAIEGSERLFLSLPWERGPRRCRMGKRRDTRPTLPVAPRRPLPPRCR